MTITIVQAKLKKRDPLQRTIAEEKAQFTEKVAQFTEIREIHGYDPLSSLSPIDRSFTLQSYLLLFLQQNFSYISEGLAAKFSTQQLDIFILKLYFLFELSANLISFLHLITKAFCILKWFLSSLCFTGDVIWNIFLVLHRTCNLDFISTVHIAANYF